MKLLLDECVWRLRRDLTDFAVKTVGQMAGRGSTMVRCSRRSRARIRRLRNCWQESIVSAEPCWIRDFRCRGQSEIATV